MGKRAAMTMPTVAASNVDAFASPTLPDEVTPESVRASIAVAKVHGERFFEQIVWQVEHEVWTVLGYTSWDEMRAAEYGDMGVVAPRADRPELVARLRAKGLTQSSIAGTLGTSQATVSSTLKTIPDNDAAPAAITNARGQERPTSYAKRPAAPAPTPEPRPVETSHVIERAVAEVEAVAARTVDLSTDGLPADRAAEWARRLSVAITTLRAFAHLIEGQA